MWWPASVLERIRELESLLRDSVPKADYISAQARIAELERRVDWQADMLLRRGQSYPLPPLKAEPEVQTQPIVRQPTETDISKAEAIRMAGREANASPQAISDEIKLQTGFSEAEIKQAQRIQ